MAGGHGYSKYTGLSGTLQDFAVMCTWEGDNTVMALQTARSVYIYVQCIYVQSDPLTS